MYGSKLSIKSNRIKECSNGEHLLRFRATLRPHDVGTATEKVDGFKSSANIKAPAIVERPNWRSCRTENSIVPFWDMKLREAVEDYLKHKNAR